MSPLLFPVCVKGVVPVRRGIALLENERGEFARLLAKFADSVGRFGVLVTPS